LATALSVTASAGSVTLTDANNDVDSLSVSNGTRPVSFTDKDGLSITGVTGGTITLAVGGDLTQTGPIAGASLDITATAGSVTLTNANNDVDSLTVNNGTRPVSFTDKDGLSLAGVTGGSVTLAVGGDLTQAGPISATSLSVTASAGSVTLTDANNDVDSLTVNNGTRAVSFTDKDGLSITGVTGGTITLAVGGDLTQTGPIAGASLDITATAGSVTLTNANNDVDSLAVSNANGDVTFSDKDALSLAAVTAQTVSLAVGGNLTQTGPITAASLDITATAGSVTLTNANNDVDSLAVNNGTRAVSFTDINGLVLAGVTGGSITLAVGGDLTQTGPIAGTSLDITVTAGSVTLTNANNDVDSLAVSNANGNVTFTDKDALSLAAVTAQTVTLAVGGNLTQTAPITAASLDITATAGSVTLTNANNDVDSLAVNNGTRAVSFADKDDLVLHGLTAGPTSLTVGDKLSQTAPVNCTQLTITSTAAQNGGVLLNTFVNDVESLSVFNPGRRVMFTDANDLVIDGITAGPTTITLGGKLSQTAAPIIATQLTVISTAVQNGGILLNTAVNDVESISVSNPGRRVMFTEKNDIVINGITAGPTTLTVGGKLSQTAVPIISTQLTVVSTAVQNGGILLNTAMNDVDVLSVSNPGRRVMFTDTDDLSIAGITADSITLNVGGDLTQTSQIVGNSLTVAATAGSVTLTNASNSVAAATISNGNRAVSFVNALALTLGGLTMGTGSLTVGGNLSQTGPISGSSLSITSSSGSIDLRNSANNLDSLSVSNGSRLFSYADSSSVAITSAGTLSVGTVTAAQQLTVTTTNGGNVDVGPQPNGLLQSGGTLDLRAVQGASIIRNGGRIVGNPILLPPGTGIQVGGAITTPAELNAAVSTLNSLPASPGPTYEIFVASSMTLTQQLTVSRPVIFRGASQSTVVSGGSGVTNGLLLDSGASGSVVRDIAFSSFSGDAIRLTSATGITIKGIQANNSGNGLSINGTSTNTVVQGNTFGRNQTGVSLVSATGALVGGMNAGQGNVISSAVRQGVFASGFCTGSQVVKNTFPGTATPYNVSGSRNLTIID
jgi:filamentous hemagglutinin